MDHHINQEHAGPMQSVSSGIAIEDGVPTIPDLQDFQHQAVDRLHETITKLAASLERVLRPVRADGPLTGTQIADALDKAEDDPYLSSILAHAVSNDQVTHANNLYRVVA